MISVYRRLKHKRAKLSFTVCFEEKQKCVKSGLEKLKKQEHFIRISDEFLLKIATSTSISAKSPIFMSYLLWTGLGPVLISVQQSLDW